MIRMNGSVARTLQFYHYQPWAVKHAKNPLRYIHHLIYADPLLWARFFANSMCILSTILRLAHNPGERLVIPA